LIPAPVAGTFDIPFEIRRGSQGIYGWKGVLKVPTIANGAASATELRIRFRKGIFSASCPTGKSQAQAVSRFADGTTSRSSAIQTCRTATASR